MTRAGHPREGARGEEAQRLRNGTRGKDKTGDDRSPAIRAENAGLNRREEAALDNENGRPYGLNMKAQVIKERVEGDPRSPGRDQHLKRH